MFLVWVGICGCYFRIDVKNIGVMDVMFYVGGYKFFVCWIWIVGEYFIFRCFVLCVRRSVVLIVGRVLINLLLMNFIVVLME